MLDAAAASPTMAENDRNLTAQVQMAQLKHVYDQNINALVGQPLAAVLVSILLAPVVPPVRLIIWLAALVLVQVARYLYARRFHALPRPFDARQRLFWSRTHVLTMTLTAVMWSIGVYMLWPADSGFHQVTLLFAITITTSAALVGYSIHKWSYIAYTVFALIPVGLRFLAEGSSSHVILGICCFVSVAFLFRIAAQSNKAGIEALIIGIKYREQAAVLAEEKARTETLNHQLLEQTKALQESEARFRGLSDAAFEGIAIHADGLILDANQAALDMLGYLKAEIEGLRIFDLISPEFHEIASKHIQQNYDKPYEIAIMHKDGFPLSVEVQAKTIPYAEKQVRVVAVRDTSFRKQIEQQALTLKLEHARIELLQTFFQNASHEFNTPLSIIRTSAYLAQRADIPEKRQQWLDKIDQQVERISQLVNDLAFLMKLDTDIKLRRSTTDVNALLRTTTVSLGKAFAQKGHHLVFQLDDTLPSLQADPGILAKAFYAVLQNAERYTPEDGLITIRTGCSDASIYVEIQDNGSGMPEEALAHIFDRFYRVDEAHSTMGFGIGLSIARSIVELHHGSISAQSQPDEGSTFTLKLPLTSA